MPDKYNDYLTEEEVSQMLRRAVATIRKWRVLKKPPNYVKIGGKVYYRRDQIEEFLKGWIKEVNHEN